MAFQEITSEISVITDTQMIIYQISPIVSACQTPYGKAGGVIRYCQGFLAFHFQSILYQLCALSWLKGSIKEASMMLICNTTMHLRFCHLLKDSQSTSLKRLQLYGIAWKRLSKTPFVWSMNRMKQTTMTGEK